MNRTAPYHLRSKRHPPPHDNARTAMYLHCLTIGARVVDPGDLDPSTENELERLVATGVLVVRRNHGRRVWRKADAWET